MAKILKHKEKNFLYKGQDLHTMYGFIKKEEIEAAASGTILKTNLGREMFVLEANFSDLYRKIKRLAQIIPQKDICAIIANTCIGKDSVIVDAGSGSGALACFLGNIAKKVYTYDIREDHANITKKNIEFLGVKNVVQRMGSIYDGVKHKNVDVLTLDVPEPWLALDTAEKILKSGGFIVSYSPCITQVSDFVEAVHKKEGLINIRTIEMIEREWEVVGRKVRPKSVGIGHSGFLSYARKV